MLLLYLRSSSRHRKQSRNLHSTMLLLYPISEAGEILLLECIYIPLCFYFILQRSCQQCRGLPFTFHYASTLSDLEMLLREEQKFIYIPLCFYFIGNSSERRERHSWIYIPLCFYFILCAFSLVFLPPQIYIPLCFYFIQAICELRAEGK